MTGRDYSARLAGHVPDEASVGWYGRRKRPCGLPRHNTSVDGAEPGRHWAGRVGRMPRVTGTRGSLRAGVCALAIGGRERGARRDGCLLPRPGCWPLAHRGGQRARRPPAVATLAWVAPHTTSDSCHFGYPLASGAVGQLGVPSASDGMSLAAATSLKIARSSALRSCLRVADMAAKAAV
jgi:hypothetical protein